uniref:DUF4097 family beta strand repeat-containing protein n=1 Tax=Eubacterium cellulosolvens TaxID=29322 RepID=UPI000482A5A6|nr:DUF4097 family beta strand repeat-containing protein [[Eubacterium] cellulosolvens]
MKRGVYTAVLSILTIGAIVWGSAVHLFGVSSDFSIGKFGLPVFHIGSDNGKKADYTENVDAFKNLDVDVNVAGIRIVEGEKYAVEYRGLERLKPEITQKGDSLKIEQKNDVKVINLTGKQAEITVVVPKGQSLDDCEIRADLGNVNIKGIKINTLESETDAGNVNASGCDFETVTMEANMGNINIKDCDFEVFSADMDMGNAKLDAACDLDDASFDLHADLGNIKVNGDRVKGDYKVKGSDSRKVKISADLGNIKIVW